jgi:hypothetical protein
MRLTEKEARTKWCPFANQPGYGNRNVPASQGCVASDCMMWRKVRVQNWAGSTTEARGYEAGYCGLAGRAEDTEPDDHPY